MITGDATSTIGGASHIRTFTTARHRKRLTLVIDSIRRQSAKLAPKPRQMMFFGMLAALSAIASACGGSGGGSGGSTPAHQSDTFVATNDNMDSSRIGAGLAMVSKAGLVILGGLDSNLETPTAADLYNSRRKRFKPSGGDLTAGRDLATSTRLTDGTVLIAGGADQNGLPLSSAEIYDPSKGSFHATGNNMSDSRYGAIAVLLPNGKVLIAGGADADGLYLASADLYDPASGKFTASTGAMNEMRQFATAAVLNNGKVLIAGGFAPACGPAACGDADLYDPAGDSFTLSAGSMSEGRSGAVTAPLPGGKVLIVGGAPDGQVPTTSADLYDPNTDAFVASAGVLATARVWAVAAPLPSGKVLIAGGQSSDNPSSAVSSAELYDPASDTFSTSKGQMTASRAYAVASSLSNGTILIAGGMDSNGEILNSADIYFP